MKSCTQAKKGALRVIDYNLTSETERLLGDFFVKDFESACDLCDDHNEKRMHQFSVCMIIDEYGVAVYGLGQFVEKRAKQQKSAPLSALADLQPQAA